MNAIPREIVLCNGAQMPPDIEGDARVVELEYLPGHPKRLINLQLPKFIDAIYHLPDRILDLLEIAAYVFAADRRTKRGTKNALEYHAWPRSFHFFVRVRDYAFWHQASVKEKLCAALAFMTGDHQYTFNFLPGQQTPPTSLFDREEFKIAVRGDTSVVLFSGGLDSLTGVVERLQTTEEDLYLISHRSGQPSTKKTQNQLFKALEHYYPGRLRHYSFDCGLSRFRAAEESQRTRSFLFGSIAFALAHALSRKCFYAYENGITSLNLLRRQDLINARASRTTHPKTLFMLSALFSEIEGTQVKVVNPYWLKTKTDVFKLLDCLGRGDLINSAVSCSRTFQHLNMATHCGCCFQCIDRRLAAYASGLHEADEGGIYAKDIITTPIDSDEAKMTSLDYIKQACSFAESNIDSFYYERLNELADITDYIEANDETDAVEKIWGLCNRHGAQVIQALHEMRRCHDNLCQAVQKGSLLQLVSDRVHLKPPSRRLAEKIADRMKLSIPVAFQTRTPLNEDEVNNQVSAILYGDTADYRREFPVTMFALAGVVPDHELQKYNLLVETKFIRKGTTPSKVSEGIAADITKYPAECFILFLVYDPDRAIVNDEIFTKDIESKRDCIVAVIR